MAIAANEGRQLARRRGRRQVREIALDQEPGSMPPAELADRIDLANALRALDDRDRTIVALRYLAGLDSPAIGRVVGMTPTGVRSRLARAIDRLRLELDRD